MKSLRTRRDEQQWMLDLALNMRGRVQNFERDDWETPKRAHNYRMLPKMWRQKAEHDEAVRFRDRELWTILNMYQRNPSYSGRDVPQNTTYRSFGRFRKS